MDCKDLKISEMQRANHLHGGDLIPIVQHGKNKTINVQDLVDLFKRILPPGPCHHHDDFPCPDHHGHCGNPYDHDWEFNLMNRARQDAAIAKASASSMEGRINVAQRTADTALDASQKALKGVGMLKGQIDKIRYIVRQQQLLEAEVRNDRRKIKNLNTIVLALIEKIKDLDPSNTSIFGDEWLAMLQEPDIDNIDYNPCPRPHHHHHHHSTWPIIGDETEDSWVDSNVTGDDDDDVTSEWTDDNLNG